MLQLIRQKIAQFVFPEIFNQCQKLSKERRTAQRASMRDGLLPQLANRRAFDLAKASATNDPSTAFVLFDMNNFGQVNKLCGHATGDAMLRSFANDLVETAALFGVAERCFRLGGDEFVVICPIRTANFIRDEAEQRFGTTCFDDLKVSVSGSTGRTLEDADRTLQSRKKEQKSK